MKRKITALVCVMLITVLLAGCGKAQTNATSAPAADKEMVVGIPKIAGSFDFYNATSGAEGISMEQIYDTLVIKDKNGKTAPSLAASYEISPDGKTYTFNLRKGVKFSNGLDFTSADAKFSIDQSLKSTYTSWCYADVVSCDAVDNYTVKLNLKKPNVGFIEYLANCYYSAMVSKATVEKFGKTYGTTVESSIGTGPYILKEWKPGEECVFVANPNYFLGAPAIKTVQMKTISDVNAAVIALQTGEIQAYFNDIPGINYDSVAKMDNLKIVPYASTILFQTMMNTKTGPFADLRMRQAVAYAIDREKMLTVGAEGKGVITDYPGNRQGYTEGDPVLKNTWYPVDLDKAKQLVKDAGMEGKSITIKTYSSDPYTKLATILQDTLIKIGLKADVQQMERSAFLDEVTSKGIYDIAICRWAAGTKDMDELWYGSFNTASIGPAGNWSLYSNPAMDKLLEDARAQNDPEARKKIYTEAIKIFDRDVPIVPLYYPNGSRAYSKDLVIDKGNVEYDRLFSYSWVK